MIMKTLNITAILLIVFLLSSCYTRYTNNLLQERKSLPQYEKAEFENYRLQVNDELVMRVLTTNEQLKIMLASNDAELNSYRIFEDGTADFPYIPRVELKGKTIKEAEDALRDKLREFAEDVEVKIALKTQTFCVIGEAGRGYFPIYKERLTIYQALALSGGIGDGAVFHKIKIIRTTDKGTIVKTFDIRTQTVIDSEFYYVQPNDIIYVDMSGKKFWASGNVFQFITLISSSLTFLISVLSIK